MSETWNPRYLAYCRAHGEPDPDKTLERDLERWPGGVMAGYIIWIGERWAEWKAANGIRRDRNGFEPVLSDADHAVFDAWLAARTGMPLGQEGAASASRCGVST